MRSSWWDARTGEHIGVCERVIRQCMFPSPALMATHPCGRSRWRLGKRCPARLGPRETINNQVVIHQVVPTRPLKHRLGGPGTPQRRFTVRDVPPPTRRSPLTVALVDDYDVCSAWPTCSTRTRTESSRYARVGGLQEPFPLKRLAVPGLPSERHTRTVGRPGVHREPLGRRLVSPPLDTGVVFPPQTPLKPLGPRREWIYPPTAARGHSAPHPQRLGRPGCATMRGAPGAIGLISTPHNKSRRQPLRFDVLCRKGF